MNFLRAVEPSPDELRVSLPGDDLVARPGVVMDRGFDLPAGPEVVWPWIVQLGKRRGGWYLPGSVERWLPAGRRGLRVIDPHWQDLAAGAVIPDWGGASANFEVALIRPPAALVYRSTRGAMVLSWAITLTAAGDGTRVHLRLRLGQLKRRWLAAGPGELIDRLTVAGLALGLRERVRLAK